MKQIMKTKKLKLILLAATFGLSVFLTTNGQAQTEETENIPLPQNAQGPAVSREKGYLVEEIRDGLYWVTDGLYNAMFLVYDQGVVVVDAPPTIGENYLKAVREVTDKPITHVIYSHSHTDHIGAANLFPKTAKFIAHEETAKTLARRKDSRRPVPTQTFKTSYTLKVGKQILQLDYKGNAHEAGNIFIYAPKQKVLMLVDIIYPGWVPYKNLGIAADVQSYIEAHDLVLQYDFDKLVSGHVTRLGTKQDVRESLEYVTDLRSAVERAYQKISIYSIFPTVKNPNGFKVFDAYQKALTKSCETEMLGKWKTRLGAAETYTPDNCWMIIEAVGVDLAPSNKSGK